MSSKYRKLVSFFNLFLVLVFISTSGFGCALLSSEEQQAIQPITLKYWRVWEDQDAFDEIIKDYRLIHPNINIEYRKFRYEEFERELLNALAEDRGPDIFSIPQPWLLRYQNKIAPMPKEITMAYQTIKGTIKKETVIDLKTTKSPTAREVKENFVDTVSKDVTIEDQIYGLPLSLETLIMLYNKDITNQAGIAQVPNTWKAFQEAVSKITKIDTDNNIISAGTALGTGSNVDHSFDILSALLMQNQAPMTDANNFPTFFRKIKVGNKDEYPGQVALQFYADFASPQKAVYSWNESMPIALDSFIAGKVGYIFNYTYNVPTIKSRAPKLNFAIAPLPQIAGNPIVNYADYWLETVSKKSTHQNEAWDFIIFATKKEEAKKFLDVAKRPTALKALVDEQLEVEELYPAVSQVLTAKTWYRGYDFITAEKAMQDMMDKYLKLTDEKLIRDLLSVTVQKIQQTIVPPRTTE